MSDASSNYAREKTARSLDTIVVYNPTQKDKDIWNDKFGPTRNRTTIPGSQRDIGHGKGVAHIPRFIAERYSKAIVESNIHEFSEKKWAKRKKEITMMSRDQQWQTAVAEQVRTNNPGEWYKYFPYDINRELTGEETLEEVIASEKAYREEKGIDIPVKTLVWWGVAQRFGGDALPEPEGSENILDKDPFSYDT